MGLGHLSLFCQGPLTSEVLTLKSSHTLDGPKNQEETRNEMQVADPIFYLHRNRPRGQDETMSKKQPLAPLASERFFRLGTLISLNVFS